MEAVIINRTIYKLFRIAVQVRSQISVFLFEGIPLLLHTYKYNVMFLQDDLGGYDVNCLFS